MKYFRLPFAFQVVICSVLFLVEKPADNGVPQLASQFERVELESAQFRSCTGVLASHPRSRDLKIDSFTVTFHGAEIVTDTRLEFNSGRRYGLVGLNGSGTYIPTCSLWVVPRRALEFRAVGSVRYGCGCSIRQAA